MHQQRSKVSGHALLRVCVAIFVLATVWAYAVAFTGGFALEAGPVRFSSRNPRAALLLMVLAGVAAWMLDRKPDWRLRRADDLKWLSAVALRTVPGVVRRHATLRSLAVVIATMTVMIGVVFGAHAVGGADSYGYVSQAHLWATGMLEVPQPLLDDLPPDVPQQALVPLGYRLSPDRSGLVPMYAPGLPMTMAVFERVGGQNAVFLVMPLLAGLVVWGTYSLGATLIGEPGGVIAAILLATSPTFLFQLLYPPLSDIAAAGWWTTALWLVWRPSRVAAFLAGLATAAAILTRPNLVPLAAIPFGLLLLGLGSHNERSLAVQRVVWFGAPSVVACSVVAYLNAYWYGSPLASGYGTLAGELFRWDYFWPNVTNYTRWIIESQGPLILLSLVGLLTLWWRVGSPRGRIILASSVCFAFAVYACYALYLPLEAWWSLRFLITALPVFFILLAAGVLAIADRLPRGWRGIAVAVVVAALTIHASVFSRSRAVFTSYGELRYEIVGRYVSDNLPSRAVVFAMLHSGSVRYYSGRLTVRYDWIPPDRFDAMVAHLRQRGYIPFLVLDDAEEQGFRNHFAGTPLLNVLGTPRVRFERVSLFRVPQEQP